MLLKQGDEEDYKEPKSHSGFRFSEEFIGPDIQLIVYTGVRYRIGFSAGFRFDGKSTLRKGESSRYRAENPGGGVYVAEPKRAVTPALELAVAGGAACACTVAGFVGMPARSCPVGTARNVP